MDIETHGFITSGAALKPVATVKITLIIGCTEQGGIRVCDEWNDFMKFYAWATANGYSEMLTIDRIDTDGDYCPSNCRWVTWKAQANNKRTNHYITFQGKRATLQQWADSVGIKANTLLYRLKRGWSVERALTT